MTPYQVSGRVTWPALERLLEVRPGWRRRGVEWHGPCPVSGDGRDTCWAAPGAVDAVRLGCRRCGGRLDARGLADHLSALGALSPSHPVLPSRPAVPSSRPRRRSPVSSSGSARGSLPAHALGSAAPSALPSRVWRAAERAAGTPGCAYLCARLGISVFEPPPSVRWLSAAVAASVRGCPRLPAGAAGALVYAFTAAVGLAVQLEAVNVDAGRVLWRRGAKRWSVPGSDFGGGRRRFVARRGEPGRGVWLCEGPLDALAVAVRERVCGVRFLAGAAVFGAAGAVHLTPAAVEAVEGPVVVAAQDDKASLVAAVRLARALARAGRSVEIRRPREGLSGLDWCDAVRLEAGEREAIRDE